MAALCELSNYMETIIFKPVSLEDRQAITRFTLNGSSQICDLAFSNLYGWAERYGTSWAVIGQTLIIRFQSPLRSHPTYLMPVGSAECNLSVVMTDLQRLAEEGGYPLVLMGVSERCREALEDACPNQFSFERAPGSYDYVYLREKLCTLSGKSLQPKRNHINKFERSYPDYLYEPITRENIDECLAVEREWFADHGAGEGRTAEMRMIERICADFEALGLSGGALRVDGKIIAFTIGSPINQTTFGVHIEKADRTYDGAFTMINREFARRISEQYVYVNREEDLGIEGLRQAKLSYKPEFLLYKDTATQKHAPKPAP